MTFEQLLRIMAARKKLAALIFFSILLLTLLVSLILPKSYKATATVLADVKPDPVSGFSQLGTATPTNYLSTQADIIQSPNVVNRVIRTLHLQDIAATRAKWQEETGGHGDYEAWLGELISKGLLVKPSRDSNVLDITYKAVDPKFAVTLANTFAKAYIDSIVQMKVDPARNYAEFFEERARIAREKLEKAQERLTAAQRDKGIIATEERLDVETSRLSELGAQLVMSRTQIADSNSRNRAAQARGDNFQDVLNNSVVSGLKADVARLHGRLQELSSRYGDNHPQVIETKASIQELESRIKGETVRIQSSMGVNSTIAQTRDVSMQAAYDEQRAKLLKLKQARSELSVLEQDLNSAQRIYDAIQLRLSQVNLESNSSQSNIYLLSAATEPSEASSPHLVLNMIIAFFPAALLAILACIGVEMRDRRVRGAYDLLQLDDIPVIGIMPSPLSKKRELKRLNQSSFGRHFPLPGQSIKNAKSLAS
jgi:succinoglycan biosynthesis transport protein ExoP